jgi:predicted negative regulator of RcsB-dependent stress response
MDQRKMTEAQRAYEAKRAAKAGMSLDKWLANKEKDAALERVQAEKLAKAEAAPKKPGFFARLLEKAQKPL